MIKRLTLWFLLSVLGLSPAIAQPVCSSAFPGAVACQAQAVNLQLTDIVAGTQQNGPNRANQSVKISLSQILNLPGSTQYLALSGGTLTGKLNTAAASVGGAGLNLPPGSTPLTPSNGDLWTTTAGLFVRVNGATLGPLGAGGGVNTSTQYAIGYYANDGNTVSGLTSAVNSVLVTNGSAAPSLATTLPAGITAPLAILQPAIYANTAALPAVTSANEGQLGEVTSCQNGTETSGTATGCIYRVNNAGTWVPWPVIPTQQITVGGQPLSLGDSTVNQGNGSKIATFNGSGTSGNCVSINASGALVDAGTICGGGSGGNGTVTSGTANQLAWYASSGTAVAGLASINNGVLSTNGSGVPALSTTLPSGLTIPAPTISNAVLTGTASYIGLTGTGKLTSAASTTTQAGFNVAPGVAPTSPANGDIWSTTAGFFMRYNGGTFTIGSGNGTITGITTPGPITGGGTTGNLTLACSTCLTSSPGGTLIATAPLQISGATLSLGNQIKPFIFDADQYTTVGPASYPIFLSFPYATGSVAIISGLTGGSGSPSFTAGVQVNGTTVCSATISSATATPITCGANAIVSGNPVTLVISGVNGSPSSASVQVTYTASAS